MWPELLKYRHSHPDHHFKPRKETMTPANDPSPANSSVGTLNAIITVIDTTNRVLQLAPGIIALIQALQALFPQPKAGPVRKQVLMASVAAEYPAVRAAVSTMVDTTVSASKTLPVPVGTPPATI